MKRRSFLRWLGGAAAAPALLGVASEQTCAQAPWPSRHVKLVVPFPPAGSADVVARLLADRLSEKLGQQVVVENKGGAGGNIAAQMVAQAPPDGYTIFLASAFLASNSALYASLPYDPDGDFAPVSLVCDFANLMVVPNSSPARSVTEFIAHAKANRGKITFASSGIGASPHLTGELFKRSTGIEMTHVPYRGGGPALNDLIPGRIDVMFATLPSVLPHVQGGVLRGLAVSSRERIPFASDFPTIAESGVPGFDVSSWYALFVPARTPRSIVDQLHDATVAALENPAVRKRYEELGASVRTSTPAELAAHFKSETIKWTPIIKDAGIKPE
jgi:tripartite-type tricarboxylate transporter receptor subunit TctC